MFLLGFLAGTFVGLCLSVWLIDELGRQRGFSRQKWWCGVLLGDAHN